VEKNMLLQANKKRTLNKIRKFDKKGLSVVIGYVLLMTVSIAMSILVYQWIKTYVPKDALTCDEGTSIFINSINYNCATGILSLTLKNNGRFGIDGYFIYASDKSGEELPTIDISSKITATAEDKLKKLSGSELRFSVTENSLSPESTGNTQGQPDSFDVSSYGRLYNIEIIPVRIQHVDNQKRIVSCSDSKISETLICNQ
jgi:hypothetical protein